ncbi:MAG: hypothetical protein ABF586_09785 [Sporolactobacillus sp.]
MRRALVFGGLAATGWRITEALMADGISVDVVSSALTAQEQEAEDEREFYFGRNSFFHRLADASDCQPTDLVYFVDTIRAQPDLRHRMEAKMLPIFENASQIHASVYFFLSSTDVYGGQIADLHVPVKPDTPNGQSANQMELFFIANVKKLRPARALIFRTDGGARTAYYAAQFAKATFQGLEVVHYFSDQPETAAVHQKLLRFVRPSN